MLEGEAQAMVAMPFFMTGPGLKIEEIPLKAVFGSRHIDQRRAVSRSKVKIMNEVFRANDGMVWTLARTLELVSVFDNGMIMDVRALHVHEIPQKAPMII